MIARSLPPIHHMGEDSFFIVKQPVKDLISETYSLLKLY